MKDNLGKMERKKIIEWFHDTKDYLINDMQSKEFPAYCPMIYTLTKKNDGHVLMLHGVKLGENIAKIITALNKDLVDDKIAAILCFFHFEYVSNKIKETFLKFIKNNILKKRETIIAFYLFWSEQKEILRKEYFYVIYKYPRLFRKSKINLQPITEIQEKEFLLSMQVNPLIGLN